MVVFHLRAADCEARFAYGSLPSQSAMMPTTSLRMSDQIQTFTN
jgi:hypothetical protein